MSENQGVRKRGKFKAFVPLLSVLQGKRELHLGVLYLVGGQWRVPWSFRVYRGKGKCTPAQLTLRLGQLPQSLTTRYQVLVFADTGFCGIEFIRGVRKLRQHPIVGVRCDRKLADGGAVSALHKAGSQV
jgi:hypothetical protein